MSHLASTLPDRIELGAVRREDWATEINTRDDGLEVRNNRWGASLRSYDVSLPLMKRDDADYIALRALFAEAEGSLHSFDFTDWSDGDALVPVRFDTPLNITGHSLELDHIDTFTLVEVRDFPDEGPGPPAPAPEWIARGTLVSQTSGTINVPYPAGLLADDLAIAQMTVFDSLTGGVGFNTPGGGWVLLHNSFVNGDTRHGHYLFYKRLTGAESGTQTFTTSVGGGGSTDNVCGVMSIFRGVRTTGDPHDNQNTSDAGNDTTPSAPNLATFNENRLICNFRAFYAPGSNFQPGTDYDERYDVTGTAGLTDTGLFLTTMEATLPQTYTGETATIGSTLSQEQNTISVALRP